MGYIQSRFALRSRPGALVHLFHPARAEAVAQGFGDVCARDLRPAAAPQILEVEGAIFHPGRERECLYDASGARIEASCVRQFDETFAAAPWMAADRPSLPSTVLTIDGPVVYQSVMFPHWGHFLLETLSRAWALQARPELADCASLFVNAFPALPGEPQAECLSLAGLKPPPALPAGAAVRFARCFVPQASFALGGFADPAHRLAPRRVAERLLGRVRKDPRPVYLSRSAVASHRPNVGPLRNETEFEARLRARGVRIVHMQRHGLAEQIAIVNAHDVFIAPWGSAAHNILFRLDDRDLRTFLLVGGFAPTNFLLVDSIGGGEPHYLMTLKRPADFETARQHLIDIDATLDYLGRCGAV